ncbi:MAG TPA: L,D-transpeptidase [Gammaproteobacteria bacterium]|nr:L,D-transpeptidase [Gammaproteobacteria bacterium]
MSPMPACHIDISLAEQRLRLMEKDAVTLDVAVSTAAKGPGEQWGSECTPRGWHVIRAKIGAGAAVNSVFVGRRPTGERYSPALARAWPGRDWILTRILWLSGLEVGRNRLGPVDTMRRYIYLHGSPDSVAMGVPGSRGCVRLRNADIVELFDRVPAGTRVLIRET